MTAICYSILPRANSVRREHAGTTPQGVRLIGKILAKAQAIPTWRRSPQKHIARAAGVSPRSVEYWNGGRGLSSQALANLIRSEEGFRFLDAVMDGHRPKWWRLCESMMRLAEVREMHMLAKRKLRHVVSGAMHADQDIAAAIERAEIALSVCDQDFAGPQFDGYRTARRLPDRAVAQTAPQGKRR